MRLHTQTATWGTHIGVGRARDVKGWYDHVRDWWAARKAMRRDAKLAAIAAQWDARREALTPLRADAAPEMAAAHNGLAAAATLYSLTL